MLRLVNQPEQIQTISANLRKLFFLFTAYKLQRVAGP